MSGDEKLRPFIIDRTPGVCYTVHVARRRWRCDRAERHAECELMHECSGWIEPGQRYVRAALPPGGDIGNTTWWLARRHAAEREGRPS